MSIVCIVLCITGCRTYLGSDSLEKTYWDKQYCLDRTTGHDIEHDNIAYEIVSAVIRIAKSKKIETIAEGIENKVQESILRMAGCDYAQGYLYGKPMPPENIQELFEQDQK